MSLTKFKDKLAKDSFGRTLSESKEKNICVMCGASCEHDDFKDDLSRKEYSISGICQKCQDDLFG